MNDTTIEQPRELSLADLLKVVWRLRISMLVGLICGVILAIGYLAWTSRVYEAEIIIAPASDSEMGGDVAGLLGQLGGVGSLLGVNLPGGGSSQVSLAVLRSRAFAATFIDKQSLLPEMYPDKWDSARNAWRSDLRIAPMPDEVIRRFEEKIRFIEEDRRTGLVSVRLQLSNRLRVAQLTSEFVAEANEVIRQRAIKDAESALKYLRKQAGETAEIEVQQAIYRVMESQLKVAALARTRADYAFRVVDPATEPSPRNYVSPRAGRVLASGIVLGLMTGMIGGFLLALIKDARRPAASDV